MTTSTPDLPPWPAISLADAHGRPTAPGSRFEVEEVVIRGQPTRCWKHAPRTMRDVLGIARAHGVRDFLVYEDERATFEAFFRAVSAIAHVLKGLGVEKGDRVALIMRNVPEWPAIFYGAGVIGEIVTPMNAWWTGAELEYGLADSGAKIAFMDDERLARARGHLINCPVLERVFVSRARACPTSHLFRVSKT